MKKLQPALISAFQRLELRLYIGVLCSMALLAIFARINTPTHPVTPEQATIMIAHDLPIGSERRTVEKWLSEHSIVYEYRDATHDDGKHELTDISARRKLSGIVYAGLNDTRRVFFTKRKLGFTFYFDHSQRLMEFKVDEMGSLS